MPFRGRVADQDQSNIWPLGTCLGIRNGQSTEVVVDCAAPHALEITGTEDLSNVFTQAAPSVEAQDSVVQDACTSLTKAYLAPTTLASTGLVLRYRPIEAAGWDTGTRKIACRIGFPKPDGSWATLVGDAENGLVVDGRPAVSPPPPSPVEPPPTPTVDAAPPEFADDTTDPTEVAAPQQAPTHTGAPVTVTTEAPSSAVGQPHLVESEAPGPQSNPAASASPTPEQHLAGSEPATAPQPHLAGPGPAPGPPADQTPPIQRVAGQAGN
ncbi:MAG: hypothetical protein NVSMB60_25880 [Mycobacterium sp.]